MMAGFLVHQGATVLCLHTGQAQPVTTDEHVKLGGQPVAVQSSAYTIAVCTLPPPTAGNGPCTTAKWTTAAAHVRAGGVPVLLQDSQAICAPSGTGLSVLVTQTRVKGS